MYVQNIYVQNIILTRRGDRKIPDGSLITSEKLKRGFVFTNNVAQNYTSQRGWVKMEQVPDARPMDNFLEETSGMMSGTSRH